MLGKHNIYSSRIQKLFPQIRLSSPPALLPWQLCVQLSQPGAFHNLLHVVSLIQRPYSLNQQDSSKAPKSCLTHVHTPSTSHDTEFHLHCGYACQELLPQNTLLQGWMKNFWKCVLPWTSSHHLMRLRLGTLFSSPPWQHGKGIWQLGFDKCQRTEDKKLVEEVSAWRRLTARMHKNGFLACTVDFGCFLVSYHPSLFQLIQQ